MQPKALEIPDYLFAWRHEETTSTMDLARELAPTLAHHENGAGLVCAKRQTAGRGRQGRSWSGAGDCFMATFLFASRAATHQFSGYSLAVGCVVAETLAKFGASVALKWPNDLVVVKHGELKKLGGILLEVHDVGEQRVVLVGIGINLLSAPQDVSHATSVLDVCGCPIAAEQVEAPLAAGLRQMHLRFLGAGGFAQFATEWMQRSCFIPGSTEVCVDLGTRTASGTFEGLDPNSGALLLRSNEGIEALHSGHVSSLSGLRSCG